MLQIVLAGASMIPGPETLAGVKLGDTSAAVIAAHPEAAKFRTEQGVVPTWTRREGGSVTVLIGDTGGVAEVDFKEDESKGSSIDLPCIGNFPVQDSHVNLRFALEQDHCASVGEMGTYQLNDGSVVTVTFENSGDGPLREAVWYQPGKQQSSALFSHRFTSDLAFQAPSDWTYGPSPGGGEMWVKGCASHESITALATETQPPQRQPGWKDIVICGVHPAVLMVAKSGQAWDVEGVGTTWGSERYIAVYVRPASVPPDPNAEAAIRSLCLKRI